MSQVPAAHAESFNQSLSISALSDYRWRGVSLSDEKPSLQLANEVSDATGLSLSGEANTVSDDLGGLELGVTGGWSGHAAALDWTIAAAAYVYPGAEDFNYHQFDVSAAHTFGPVALSAGLEYAPEQTNLASDDHYVWGEAEWTLNDTFALHGHVGRDDGACAVTPRALDFNIGARASIKGVDFDLTYVDSDSADSAVVLGVTFSLMGRR